MTWKTAGNWIDFCRHLAAVSAVGLALSPAAIWAQAAGGKSVIDDPFAPTATEPKKSPALSDPFNDLPKPPPEMTAPSKPAENPIDIFAPVQKNPAAEPRTTIDPTRSPGGVPSTTGNGVDLFGPNLNIPPNKSSESPAGKNSPFNPGTVPAEVVKKSDASPTRSPSDSSVTKAKELIETGKNLDALKILADAIRVDPRDAEAFLWRGVAERNLGHLDDALEALNESIHLDSTNGDAFLRRAIVWYYKNEWKIAEADLEDAQSLATDDPRPELYKGLIAASRADYWGAVTHYNKCLRLIENPVIETGDVTAAVMRSRLSTMTAAVYTNRGLAYNKIGDLHKASFDFDQALRLDPKSSMAWYRRAVVQQQAGAPSEALSSYSTAIKLDSNNARAYYNRGTTYAQLGNPQLAAKDKAAAIKLDSSLK